jgi:transketolase
MNYEEILINLAEKNNNIVVMTAENRAAIRNLPSKIKDQFVDVGIAEQTMIGMAAGLALRGRTPIVHALSTFLTMRAFEFIRTDVGIGNLPVKIVGAVAGFLSEANGPTHQAIEDISLMRGIPHMHVFAPADEEDLIIALPEIISSPHPSYIRFTNVKSSVVHNKEFKIGKAEILSEGEDITILTYGTLFNEALKAAEILRSKNRSVGVINLRTLKPIDNEAIENVCRNSNLIVTLEDHFITGGLYSILSEFLVIKRINARVLPIALNNKWFKPALLKDVLEYEGFTSEAIADKIIKHEQEKHIATEYFY